MISTQNKNTIKIIEYDFELKDYSIVFNSDEFNESLPISLLLVDIKNAITQEIKKSLVCCLRGKDNSVWLYI